MPIRWLKDAILDLIELRQYVAQDNPHAAQDIARRIIMSIELLRDNPSMGRIGRVEGTRELVISGLPYIIPYRIKNKVVEILRVLHGARRWPTELQ
jgi:toxin ParE1/3/4